MEMTKKVLLSLCKQHDLYRTPHLNDKLYANFQGFTEITNLEEYTGLKALFIEGNSLLSLDGLPALPELKCLCDAAALCAYDCECHCVGKYDTAVLQVGLVHARRLGSGIRDPLLEARVASRRPGHVQVCPAKSNLQAALPGSPSFAKHLQCQQQ